MSDPDREVSARMKSSRRENKPSDVIDPFAVKLTIPPMVLLGYALWKYYGSEDPRMRSIREAEGRHEQYLSESEDERVATEALSKLEQ